MPETVTVETEDGEMALYDAEPQGTPRAAVVVLQEAFGVNGHIEDLCRRLAEEGYRAVAPHLFHRSGDPVLEYTDIASVMPHIRALSERGILADLDATLRHLSASAFAPSGIGTVGFCMGGTVAFLTAARRALGAAVTFYGSGIAEGRLGIPSLLELAPDLETPWLGLFGDRDAGIPVAEVESLRVAVAAAPVPTEVVRYPEAEHGFHCDARASYHEPSARDAWRRTLGFFEAHLASG
jgi:carboxymethylenebutenolidase